MSSYHEICPKCEDETITHGWSPSTCPFCKINQLERELAEAKKNFSVLADALIEIAKRHHSQQACAEIADEALEKVKEISMREVDNMTDDQSPELAASQDSPSAKRIERLECELAEAKESWRFSSICRELKHQRDTLAEALEMSRNKLLEVLDDTEKEQVSFAGDDFHETLKVCEQALAAVKGGSHD